MKKASIGIFDSGLGGLTVMKQLIHHLPNESFIFFGDTAHVPYGNKSPASIKEFTTAIIKFLNSHSVKLIIVACNTASAVAIKEMQRQSQVPIVGVINPLKSYLQANPQYLRIAVIGTQNTVKSKAYDHLIENTNSEITIFSKACPLFVPIIEEGLENHQIAKITAKEYLNDLIKHNIDLLILGCTHYPIIKNTIKKIIPENITIIDSATLATDSVISYLKTNKLLNNTARQINIYVSDEPKQFQKQTEKYLGQPISNVEKIILK